MHRFTPNVQARLRGVERAEKTRATSPARNRHAGAASTQAEDRRGSRHRACRVSLGKSAVKGALWTLLESAGAQLGSFVLFLVFARLIEPRAIGLVQVAVTLLAFLT